MGFVHEENALNIGAILGLQSVLLFVELLDINYRYLGLPVRAAHSYILLKITHQFAATLCGKDF